MNNSSQEETSIHTSTIYASESNFSTESWNKAHEWNDTIKCQDNRFVDSYGRTLILRGVNLCGNSKLPTNPPGSTHLSEGFYNHQMVSFIGRPFPLEEADEHFTRLRTWGLTFVRLLVPWEAVEHFGPGIYDEDFINYIIKIVQIAKSKGIKCFIDPHQDTWSRFSGGSGAPGWTFEVVGLDIRNFKETGAAYLQQFAGEGDESLMIWPTNYTKLASATMFTTFFAGNLFAAKSTYKGEKLQDFLQRHFLACYQYLAKRLKDCDAVVGFEVLNEPHQGYVGLKTLDRWNEFTDLHLKEAPSAFQGFLLGEGIPQELDVYARSWPWPTRKVKTAIINKDRKRAWLPGRSCIWKENGVWSLGKNGKSPTILKNDHFSKLPDGSTVDFNQDCYLPFLKKFIETIKKIKSSYLIFFEPIPGHDPPIWIGDESLKEGLVYAPHWYDLKSIFSKSFDGFVTHDVQGLSRGTKNVFSASYFGINGAKANYAGQVKNIIDTGFKNIGQTPCLFGECGIPMDLNDRMAFETGDYTKHNMFLDAVLCAMETNIVQFTLWNYNPLNDNVFGDHWNGEDFSIFSKDVLNKFSSILPMLKLSPVDETKKLSQDDKFTNRNSPMGDLKKKSTSPMLRTPSMNTPSGLFEITKLYFDDEGHPDHYHHHGGRALDAIIRPYAAKISGIPVETSFDYLTGEFFLCFESQKSKKSQNSQRNKDSIFETLSKTTEIFIPNYHYGNQKMRILVSDGICKYSKEKQTLYWKYDSKYYSDSRMNCSFLKDEDSLSSIFFTAANPLIQLCKYLAGLPQEPIKKKSSNQVQHWISITINNE